MGGIRPLYNTNKHFFFISWCTDEKSETWEEMIYTIFIYFCFLTWSETNSILYFGNFLSNYLIHIIIILSKNFSPRKKTMFMLDIQCDLNQFKFQFLDTLCTGGIRILASHTDEKDTQICKSQIQQEYMYISHSL